MNSKQFVSTLLSVLFWQLTFGQQDTINSNDSSSSKRFVVVEKMPKYKDGEQALFKIITDSMVYPKLALKERVGGRVITQFTIDTLGNVVDIQIFQGIREDINNEAIRLTGLLNGWTPGTQNGRKVKVRCNLPMYFFPDEKFKRKYKKEHKMK